MNREYTFYTETDAMLKSVAKSHGILDINKYYGLVDFHKDNELSKCINQGSSEISKVFIQYSFHAQNSQGERLSPIVKFISNFSFLYNVLAQFEPNTLIQKYKSQNDDCSIDEILESLSKGIKWKRNKDPKKEVMRRYASRLWYGAKYFKKFNTKQELVYDLQLNITGITDPIKKLRKEVHNSLGVALASDFLKELDTSFNYISKPDTHIIDAMCSFYKCEDKAFTGEQGNYHSIEVMKNITDSINSCLPKESQITVYQLDRMIWLICTGAFFLDGTSDTKQKYLSKIQLIN